MILRILVLGRQNKTRITASSRPAWGKKQDPVLIGNSNNKIYQCRLVTKTHIKVTANIILQTIGGRGGCGFF